MRSLLLVLLLASPAVAGHLTEIHGERAVAFGGRTWTWDQLQGRRALAPGRFDANHPTLGWAISHEAELRARRDLDPARFDRFHPYLGWLLGGERLVPSPPVPPACPPDAPRPILAVPEPPALTMGATGLLGAFLARRRWGKWGRVSVRTKKRGGRWQ